MIQKKNWEKAERGDNIEKAKAKFAAKYEKVESKLTVETKAMADKKRDKFVAGEGGGRDALTMGGKLPMMRELIAKYKDVREQMRVSKMTRISGQQTGFNKMNNDIGLNGVENAPSNRHKATINAEERNKQKEDIAKWKQEKQKSVTGGEMAKIEDAARKTSAVRQKAE